jgi:membrane-bound lytic murein transglycosylase A
MRRRWALGAAAVAVAVLAAGGVAGWYFFLKPPLPDRLVLKQATFAALKGWDAGDPSGALAAFIGSCARIERGPPERSLGAGGIAGTAADWKPVCDGARALGAADAGAVRRFFEQAFVPLAAANNRRRDGLFTGYYEPELRGAERPSAKFAVPLYKRPDDLVSVDLGQFRETLKGQRTAGKVVNGALRPYASRAEIESGALTGRNLELLWVDDPIAAFFLHVQGSGRVVLEDGSVRRVGFAAQNGHPYVAIGRELIARGVLSRDEVSLQTIGAWLRANPGEAAALMNKNPSYVFFRPLPGAGAEGSHGAVLTAEHSLAVDTVHIPLGVPVWLETALPGDRPGATGPAYRRLVIAQDTGGAIKGPVRGDLFFGAGARAEDLAGRMKSQGRYYLLLPKAVVARGDPWPKDPS